MATHLLCANCYTIIEPEQWNDPAGTSCRRCGERVDARVFAVMFQTAQVSSPDRIGAEGEASCFYHADNRAAVACDSCGRFLCSLCDLAVSGRHACPDCFSKAPVAEPEAVENQRVLYDSLALHLATWPALTFWLPVVTAPAAIYFAVRYWKAPPLVIPRAWRFRMVAALVLAVAQLAGFASLFGFLLWSVPGRAK
ncbi:MAG: hypothetical protein U0Q16_18235 [Bryobacteraceae bacterium]